MTRSTRRLGTRPTPASARDGAGTRARHGRPARSLLGCDADAVLTVAWPPALLR